MIRFLAVLSIPFVFLVLALLQLVVGLTLIILIPMFMGVDMSTVRFIDLIASGFYPIIVLVGAGLYFLFDKLFVLYGNFIMNFINATKE